MSAPVKKTTWTRFMPWTRPFKASLAQAAIFSVMMQSFVLGGPLVIGLLVNVAVSTQDKFQLLVILFGYVLFCLFNAFANWARDLALNQAQSIARWAVTTGLFEHVLNLPAAWYLSRGLSNTLSYFDSMDKIKDWVVDGGVSVIIDGVLTLLTILILFLISPPVGLVSLLGIVAFMALRSLTSRKMLGLAKTVQADFLREKRTRTDFLRGFLTIKVLGDDRHRILKWAEDLFALLRSSQAFFYEKITGFSIASVVLHISFGVIIYLAARDVIDGRLNIGLLASIITYQNQITQKMSVLLDKGVVWLSLEPHRARLNELAAERGEPPEKSRRPGAAAGKISVRSVEFTYPKSNRRLFDRLSLDIEAGEHVVIVGPSGVGKSTLLRLILGLHVPDHGVVELDGHDLQTLDKKHVASAMGAVMQDDVVFTGTVQDNVVGDRPLDPAWLEECLRRVRLWDDLGGAGAPSRAVGDMGASLSGGQRQRLMLARAIYGRPKILVLDEATANLDSENERLISEMIDSLGITRIVAAHRPETIARADRIVDLKV